MKYNFDEIIDRSHTDSVKQDKLKTLYGDPDLIPRGWPTPISSRPPPS